MRKNMFVRFINIFNSLVVFNVLLMLLSSCSENVIKPGDTLSADSTVSYAKRFRIQKTDSCTILRIRDPWQGAGNIIQVYYLVREGNRENLKVNPLQILRVPIGRLICTSTTHVAMVEALGKEKSIVAVSGSGFIYSEKISEMIDEGLISDIGYDSGLNSELIIKSSPDLVMIYGIGSESAGYTSKINELGIKVMFNADYLETDPLGKAEWIRVFGALFNMEKKADSIFSEIADSYNNLKEFIKTETRTEPVVLLGLPFRDTWFISPGNSYISKLISDAGGSYLWQKTESSVSMPLSLETVFVQSLKADIWLNTGSVHTKKEIISLDPRLGLIPPFKKDKLYNNNKRINASGGNDYWESGSLNPHIILRDVASILHPGLFPGYEPVYYKRVE